MTKTIKLNKEDIIDIIADNFSINKDQIVLEYKQVPSNINIVGYENIIEVIVTLYDGDFDYMEVK